MRKHPETTAPPCKTELFARTNRRRLDSVGAIARELGKIYRAAASGTIESGEAMRLSCILRELRNAMEAQAESPVINIPAGGPLGPVIIYSIPRGCLFDQVSGRVTGPDGELDPPLQEIQPYEGTPGLGMFPGPIEQRDEPEPPPPVTLDLEAEPVVRLDRWRDRKREDEPPGVA